MREQIAKSIRENRLVVILRGVPREKLIPLCEAMYEGGVRLLELTYSANGAIPDSETAARIRLLAAHFAGRMHIGAGTVLSEEQVRLTAEAGGGFIISPDANPSVIRATRASGLVSIPGALTPTEAQAAHAAGADFVKLFPCTGLGPDYIKAIRAPLSHIDFLAVGGIDLSNIAAFRAAGVAGVGIGSGILDKRMLEAEDYDGIRELAARYIAAVQE